MKGFVIPPQLIALVVVGVIAGGALLTYNYAIKKADRLEKELQSAKAELDAERQSTIVANAANASASAMGSGLPILVGIGVDSTSTAAPAAFMNAGTNLVATNGLAGIVAGWEGYPGIGRHYLAWLEYSFATGTTTWYGDNGGAVQQSGIQGVCFA
jgi:type II secretory pathway pseudopilin PulG